MAVSEERAKAALREHQDYLLEQEIVEDFGVAVDDHGKIVIEVRSPGEIPEQKRREIQDRFADVPVRFEQSSHDKRAY